MNKVVIKRNGDIEVAALRLRHLVTGEIIVLTCSDTGELIETKESGPIPLTVIFHDTFSTDSTVPPHSPDIGEGTYVISTSSGVLTYPIQNGYYENPVKYINDTVTPISDGVIHKDGQPFMHAIEYPIAGTVMEVSGTFTLANWGDGGSDVSTIHMIVGFQSADHFVDAVQSGAINHAIMVSMSYAEYGSNVIVHGINSMISDHEVPITIAPGTMFSMGMRKTESGWELIYNGGVIASGPEVIDLSGAICIFTNTNAKLPIHEYRCHELKALGYAVAGPTGPVLLMETVPPDGRVTEGLAADVGDDAWELNANSWILSAIDIGADWGSVVIDLNANSITSNAIIVVGYMFDAEVGMRHGALINLEGKSSPGDTNPSTFALSGYDPENERVSHDVPFQYRSGEPLVITLNRTNDDMELFINGVSIDSLTLANNVAPNGGSIGIFSSVLNHGSVPEYSWDVNSIRVYDTPLDDIPLPAGGIPDTAISLLVEDTPAGNLPVHGEVTDVGNKTWYYNVDFAGDHRLEIDRWTKVEVDRISLQELIDTNADGIIKITNVTSSWEIGINLQTRKWLYTSGGSGTAGDLSGPTITPPGAGNAWSRVTFEVIGDDIVIKYGGAVVHTYTGAYLGRPYGIQLLKINTNNKACVAYISSTGYADPLGEP